MNNKKCPTCGMAMKKNGRTRAGAQRWRCRGCGSSSTHSYGSELADFNAFIGWLLSKDVHRSMPGGGRTFRRHNEGFWKMWPMPDVVDEVHRVIHVDGIYLERDLCVLIACTEEHVLSWYLARSEAVAAWSALLRTIAPPEVVVTDGGSGFASAVKKEWPSTRVQRCTFHAFSQVKRYTTTRPKLQAGQELYQLSKDLLHIGTLHQADLWVERLMQWCDFWNDFLNEKTRVEGGWEWTHDRLRKARRSLVKLVNDGTLFTYLDPELTVEGPLPSMNNVIEGGVNAQLRDVLRNHRGLKIDHRIKAVYWWCYMHTECPKSFSEIRRSMPTDDDIDLLREIYAGNPAPSMDPVEWGNGLTWSEFHNSTAYPYSVE